jgi:hypothetical protein
MNVNDFFMMFERMRAESRSPFFLIPLELPPFMGDAPRARRGANA